MISLPPNLIYDVAVAAGAKLLGKGDKRTCCCVLHEEKSPSAFVVGSKNLYGCAVCYPGTAIPTKTLAELTNQDWKSILARSCLATPTVVAEIEKSFSSDDAAAVCRLARARMLDDSCAELDQPVYEYLGNRGLGDAWDLRAYGVLGPSMTLPPGVEWWPQCGYRITVPLYNAIGETACVQARSITGRDPRVMTPKGGHMSGTVFADSRALALLRGESCEHDTILLGEGLTDYLGLSITSPVPVFCAPGTSTVVKAIGKWVYGRTLVLAMDNDEAGRAVTVPAMAAAFDNGARKFCQVFWPHNLKDACDVIARIGTDGLAEFLKAQLRGATS